jgi:cell wall assembly regulator SMI1
LGMEIDQAVAKVWQRIETCLGEHRKSLVVRPGANADAIAAAEATLGVALPADYKAWLLLHDGEDHVEGRVEWLPAFGRLLPLAVTLERWQYEQEWVEPNDPGLRYGHDDKRIRSVIRHPKRIVIAGNQWGDGDSTYLDLIPGTAGTVGQVIVGVTECDFLVVGNSFLDFLERWAAAFEAGVLGVVEYDGLQRVDLIDKQAPWQRWESALRDVAPVGRSQSGA